MTPHLVDFITAIHATPQLMTMNFAGAGVQALAWLHGVGGSSRTVLEATDRYAPASLVEAVGFTPARFTSKRVAAALARQAEGRAAELLRRMERSAAPHFGLGSTATIATDRAKRGDHRCAVATADAFGTSGHELVIEKGARDRAGEESLVSLIVLRATADACGVLGAPDLPLRESEALELWLEPSRPVGAFLEGGAPLLVYRPDGTLHERTFDEEALVEGDDLAGKAFLSGSFNPLHDGHRELARAAGAWLEREVLFELPLKNADKPAVTVIEMRRRAQQFAGLGRLAMTRAPLFVEKARLFPDAVFVIGADTAVRVVAPRFYGGDAARLHASLKALREAGARFLVAGRHDRGRYLRLADIEVPAGYRDLFEALPEDAFRMDVSSTEIRAGWS